MTSLSTITLDNGLRIYFKKEDTTNVGISIGVGIGSAYEDSSFRGISHLVEHMLFKSNRKYSYSEMSKIVEFSGGDWNGSTYWDSTIITAEILSGNLKKLVDIFFHMIINDRFLENEFENEKSVILTEIENSLNDPSSRIFQLCLQSLFGKSDLGDPISGYAETVKAISVDEAIEFKNRYYVANNMVITIIGGFSKDDLENIVKMFGKLEEGRFTKKRPSFDRPRNVIETMDTGEQCYIGYSWMVDKAKMEKIIILENVLTVGMYSILYQELREKRGLGYSYSFVSDFIEDIGYAGIIIDGIDCRNRLKVKELIVEILENLDSNGLSEEFVKGKKNYTRFILEKFKNFYGERAEDTTRRIMLGKEIESMDFSKKILEMDWTNLDGIIKPGFFAEIVPKKE